MQCTTAPKGGRFVAANIMRQIEWSHFFTLHSRAKAHHHQPKLLTHSGHGSVTIQQSDTPLGTMATAGTACATIWRITRAQCLGRHRFTTLQHCPQCGIVAGAYESLERHVVRYPNGGMRYLMHFGLVKIIQSILREVGVLDALLKIMVR